MAFHSFYRDSLSITQLHEKLLEVNCITKALIEWKQKLMYIQWNPVNTDTNGTCPSVRINGVSVLSGLSEKTLQTHVLSKKRP